MDCLVERIFAVEVGEARVACKAVALGLASVHQELIIVIKTHTAIHTHTILVLIHELLAFLPFLLEVHDTAIFTAVSVVDVVVINRHHIMFFFFFFIFFISIVKPQCRSSHVLRRRRHRRRRRRNHFLVRSLVCSEALLYIH